MNSKHTDSSDLPTGHTPLVPFADLHMHVCSQEIADQQREKIPAEMLGDLVLKRCDAKDIIDGLDAAGIGKAFVLSNAYAWGMDFVDAGEREYEMAKYENDFTASEVAKYPKRLTAFFSIHPLKDYAIAEMDRCIDQLKMPGLKLHFTNSDVDLTKPEHLEKVQKVLEHAAGRNVPVLIHFRSRSPQFGVSDAQIFVEQILAPLPELRVQMAHLGSWGGYENCVRDVFETFIQAFDENPALNKRRFYFDLSSVLLEKDMESLPLPSKEQLTHLADQLRRWGLERIFWGSDWFAFTPALALRLVLERIPLSEPEFQTIFTRDGSELFG